MPRKATETLPYLFGEPTPPAHDPGGKVRVRLPAGTIGAAMFHGEREEYRLWLTRYWGGDEHAPYALWIGMNPSTADALVDDPTVGREVTYTKDMLGLTRYVKANILDIRMTDSKKLRAMGAATRSDMNLQTILSLADGADRVIVCYGDLHKSLQGYAREAVGALRERGHDLWCLGMTKHGHPKHPLYLKKTTPLQPFALSLAA
jgi:hypothetical protein